MHPAFVIILGTTRKSTCIKKTFNSMCKNLRPILKYWRRSKRMLTHCSACWLFSEYHLQQLWLHTKTVIIKYYSILMLEQINGYQYESNNGIWFIYKSNQWFCLSLFSVSSMQNNYFWCRSKYLDTKSIDWKRLILQV